MAKSKKPEIVLEVNKVNAPEFKPFNLRSAEDRAFLRGKWLKKKDDDFEGQITCFSCFSTLDKKTGNWRALISGCNDRPAGQELFSKYEFLDGSPCGKSAK